MRFIVAGGGTGGHIYPALAIAQGLRKSFPGCRVIYVGTGRGLEADIVPKAGLSFKTISVAGFKRRLTARNLWAATLALWGLGEALRLVRSFKPRVVIGTGGYVSGPVLLAASLCGVPILIHEQNAFPGLTNRLLARVADRVALTFPEAARHLPRGAKVRVTGLPVREEILTVNREEARSKLGKDAQTVLLSFGGSRGAERLNRAMVDVVKAFCGRPEVRLYHATGTTGYEGFLRLLKSDSIDLTGQGNVTIAPYFYQIADYLAAADLVICRAGASTIAELTYLGRPAILIPYPHAAANHQEFNAAALAGKGAAVMIRDAELTGKRLLKEISMLLAAPERLQLMAENSARLGKPDALEEIVSCVKELMSSSAGR
ncbi:MAG: undecaprenyldiphospho-muramoylpentapeptide beta-N-acetylglucosaminyltransferase [Firmicutes bacterium]|nr:undecaprenyldiphospho-muramoylpentapeptide beta-N-acetylglucosaminyltransferase [Bacillota bacterium]